MKINKLGVMLFLVVISSTVAFAQDFESQNFVCIQVPGKSISAGGAYEGTSHIDSFANLQNNTGYAVIGKNLRNADGSEMGPFVLECKEVSEGLSPTNELGKASKMPEKGINHEAYASWMDKSREKDGFINKE